MADAATPDPQAHAGALRLLEGVGLNRHLVARCAAPRCDRSAPCDPSPWVAEGLGALPLRAFSPRLRCVCGSRRASLDVAPGPLTPDPHPAIYIFR